MVKPTSKLRLQKGSVLLAVVCMGMICFTLATIALTLVSYTTKATARNVERTQAKVTAEACLTEYINAFGDDYTALKTLAASHSAATPLEIDVTGGPNFEQQYGTTKIKIYSTSSGFKVESECTYMTQTQTASIFFASVSSNPYNPTNTLEAGNGASVGFVANPIDGDICFEKSSSGADAKYITLGYNSAQFNSHVYSEYSLYSATGGTAFHDVLNKTGTKNYEPNRTNGEGTYFQQAPTITTEGYFSYANSFIMDTDVGKTDMNWCNSETALKVGKTYDSSNLNNVDGYLCVNKKILLGDPDKLSIGTDSNNIDIYCHGMYITSGTNVPQKINGVTNADYGAIDDVFGFTGGEDTSPTFHGNVYVYKGTDAVYESGDLVFLSSGNPRTMQVNGSLFVKGNIYLGQNCSISCTGTFACTGQIFVVDYDGTNMTTTGGSSQVGAVISGSGGYVVNNSSVAGHISAGGLTNVVDDSTGRNRYPDSKYQPSTGTNSRESLKTVYKKAGTNNIFIESLGGQVITPGESTEDKMTGEFRDDAKDIAAKYAAAMTRTVDTAKFKKADGTEMALTESYGDVIQINGSLRFKGDNDYGSGSNANEMKKYSVKLTDEDIVLAFPVNKGNITTLIRVDTTERQEGVFLYLMYYDSSLMTTSGNDINVQCLYIDNSVTIASDKSTIVVPTWNGSSWVNKNVNYSGTDAAVRKADNKKVMYDAGGKSTVYGNGLCYVADIELYEKYSESDVIDMDKFIMRSLMTLGDDIFDLEEVTDPATGKKSWQGYDNCIFMLVPDDTQFYLGDNTQIQSIIYAPKSNVKIKGGAKTRVFGQVKAGTYDGPGDDKDEIVLNVPPANDSILGFLGAVNKKSSNTEIQYYQY